MHRHSRVYGYDPHKFDPLHIEDPLLPTNNVGRNCFRINYILRACSDALSKILSEGPSKVCTRASEFSCLQSMMIIPKSFMKLQHRIINHWFYLQIIWRSTIVQLIPNYNVLWKDKYQKVWYCCQNKLVSWRAYEVFTFSLFV